MPITKDISLLDFTNEIAFSTSRSSGPGGQNVNKVETKVELRFSIANSVLFSDAEKEKIRLALSKQLIDNDSIRVVCQENRSQLKNKNLAFKKFIEMLQEVFTEQKERKPSSIPAEVVKKRLATKKRDAEIKANRAKIDW